MSGQQAVSLVPDTFTMGGMLDDVDVRVVSARFESFDYNGQADEPVCAIALSMIPVDDDDAEERTQYYSMGGNLSKFTPSSDNKRAIPGKEGTAINKGSNAALLLSNLVTSGFPADRLGAGDISVLDGCILHVNQIAAPKRSGGDKKFEAKEGKTILIPTKVVALPEQAKAVSGKKKSSGAQHGGDKPATSAKKSGGDAPAQTGAPAQTNGAVPDDAAAKVLASDQAVGIVLGILGEKGNVSKTVLNQEAFKKGARGMVMALIAKGEWLGHEDRPWKMDGGVVSMG